MKTKLHARLATTLATGLLSLTVWAQSATPLKIVVPFNPGGGSDLFARTVAPGLSQSLKRPVIVGADRVDAEVRHERRTAVGGGLGDRVCADDAACAPAVFHAVPQPSLRREGPAARGRTGTFS
jgi:hypothetical protein